MISNILVLTLLFPQAPPPASLQLNLLTLNLNSASSTAHHQSPNSIIKIGAFFQHAIRRRACVRLHGTALAGAESYIWILALVSRLDGRHSDRIDRGCETNELTPTEVPRREKIKLKISEKESEVMLEAQSYIDWREKAEEILKFRGPKW